MCFRSIYGNLSSELSLKTFLVGEFEIHVDLFLAGKCHEKSYTFPELALKINHEKSASINRIIFLFFASPHVLFSDSGSGRCTIIRFDGKECLSHMINMRDNKMYLRYMEIDIFQENGENVEKHILSFVL